MNLLSRLKSEGVLLLHHDYRTGTFQDFSGNGKHGVPTGCYLSKDGVKFNAGTDVISCGADSIGTGACSILSLFRPTDYGGGSDGRLFSNVSGGNGVGLWISDTNDRVSFVGDGSTQANSANNSLTIGGWRTAAITRNAAGDDTDLYVDGAPSGTLAQDSGTPSAGGTMYVGNRAAFDRGFRGTIAMTIIVSRELTPAEIAELETEVRAGVPDTKEVVLDVRQSKDLLADTLSGYSDITDGTYTAGNTIPGTNIYVQSGTFTVQSETVDGETTKTVACTSAGTIHIDLTNNSPKHNAFGRWEFWVNKSSTGLLYFGFPGSNTLNPVIGASDSYFYYIRDSGAGSVSIGRRLSGSNIFLNTFLFSSYGSWSKLTINRDFTGKFTSYQNDIVDSGTNPVTNNDIDRGSYSVWVFGTGDKLALKTITERPMISLQPLNKLDQSTIGPGARVTTSNVTTGQIPGTPFWVDSGEFSIGVETVNGKPAKVLTCQVAGLIYAKWGNLRNNPDEAAYGTWEFWLKHAGASTTEVLINASVMGGFSAVGQNGYYYQHNSLEQIRLYRIQGGALTLLLAQSANDTVSVLSWDKVKITRSGAGVFSCYINGTLWSTVAGSNPATDTTNTTAKYINLVIDAGDKLALAHLDGQPLFSKYLGVV